MHSTSMMQLSETIQVAEYSGDLGALYGHNSGEPIADFCTLVLVESYHRSCNWLSLK